MIAVYIRISDIDLDAPLQDGQQTRKSRADLATGTLEHEQLAAPIQDWD